MAHNPTIKIPPMVGTQDDEWTEIPLADVPVNDAGLIELMSPNPSLKVDIKPRLTMMSPDGVPYVSREGLFVHFQRGRAQVTPEVFAELAEHQAFTGGLRPRRVYLADEQAARNVVSNATSTVITGAASSVSNQALLDEPLPGWDKLTVTKIEEAAKKGRIQDPMGALSFEYRPGGKRRVMVRRLLLEIEEGVAPDAPDLPDTDQDDDDGFDSGLPELEGDVAVEIPSDAERV